MKLKVKDVEKVTDRVRMFTLTAADGSALPAYTPGAHLDFDLGDTGTRSYSLIDFTPPPETPEEYRIAVQAEPEGQGGSKAMHALRLGDEVEASAPKNSFELHGSDAPALLVAGGIGVTPVISFATELTRRKAPFRFHYAARTRQVCAFDEKLTDNYGDALKLWFDDTNQIDVTALLTDLPGDTHVYCCGPKGMIEAVKAAAERSGVPADRVRFELFETTAAKSDDSAFEIEVNDGRIFTVPPGKSIIEVLEDVGIDVMYDCQRGDCGICQTDVLEGEPDHRDVVLSDAERASGEVMQICVSRAKTPRLKLDI